MRLPNPWIALPSLVLGGLAALLGWMVTDVSCRQAAPGAQGCPGWAALIAVAAFLMVAVGVAVLLALVFRSLAEWRQTSAGPSEE